MKSEIDICIIGGGPAGAAAALRLNKEGKPCIVLEKATYPRDKICGDALSGKILMILNRIDPGIIQRLHQSGIALGSYGMRIIGPNNGMVDIGFHHGPNDHKDYPPGFISTRMDFDHFLIRELEACAYVNLRLGEEATSYSKTNAGYQIQTSKGNEIHCRILLDASGALSRFSREVAQLAPDKKHTAGAVRQYYENVTGFHSGNYIELHFLMDTIPGYFWVFPLPGNKANVGLGMRSDEISKRGVNLRKMLPEIIQKHPHIEKRFAQAKAITPPEGYILPLGSKKRRISGDHYMLLGDAGHLIDPLTGEGIGNGMYSGFIAAEQALQCLAEQKFDAAYMQAYDTRFQRIHGTELKLSYWMQRLMAYPWIINTCSKILIHNPKATQILSKMIMDVDYRKQLLNPLFWWKLYKFKREKSIETSPS